MEYPLASAESTAPVLVARRLTKRYGRHAPVLEDLNLIIPKGAVFGLVGENGAGKSTFLRLALGFLQPSSGSISLFGQGNPVDMRHRVGYLPERPQYHNLFSAEEYLSYMGRFCGLSNPRLARRITELLGLVGLEPSRKRRLAKFSKGMLQRLGIAQALLNAPELLILDEPTSGLDPTGQKEIRDLIIALKWTGATIILSSHMLSDVERICSEVGILHRGHLIEEGSLDSLLTDASTVEIRTAQTIGKLRRSLEGISRTVSTTERSVILTPAQPKVKREVLRLLVEAGMDVTSLETRSRSLESLYYAATHPHVDAIEGWEGGTR